MLTRIFNRRNPRHSPRLPARRELSIVKKMATNKKVIAVGLSGGVDSSIAAYLLKQQGYQVVGLTMKIWDGSVSLPDEGLSGCFGPGEPRDIEAAAALAGRLGIPHHVIPLAEEYSGEILTYFRQEYRIGRTPNPCVRCNRRMKFGLLPERAHALGIAFDAFATGHYARIEVNPDSGRFMLLRAVDPAKDQSYFLSHLTQEQLATTLFPLGSLRKDSVKKIAREIGWPDLAEKQESQNFIESRSYSVLFSNESPPPGPIVDMHGNVLGQHKGIIHYTIGQRKGIGLSGTRGPLYVVRLDACANTVVVGDQQDLFSSALLAGEINWISIEAPPTRPLQVLAKIRQQHREAPARLSATVTNGNPVLRLDFEEPQMSVTPGQAVICYDGDRVLCGATIEKAIPA